jgi:IS66 Orf2 like protein.
MIPSGVEVYVASTPVDFRKGPVSLMALVRDGGVDPFNGALYVFRSKRAQQATFCIQSSIRNDRISVASPFWRTLQVAPFRRGKDLKCIYTEERRGFSREVPNWMFDESYCAAWRLDRRRSVLMGSTNLPLF